MEKIHQPPAGYECFIWLIKASELRAEVIVSYHNLARTCFVSQCVYIFWVSICC